MHGVKRCDEGDVRDTILRVLSITLWWYSYSPWEKFMRTGERYRAEHEIANEKGTDSVIRTNVHTRPTQFRQLLDTVSFRPWISDSLNYAIASDMFRGTYQWSR